MMLAPSLVCLVGKRVGTPGKWLDQYSGFSCLDQYPFLHQAHELLSAMLLLCSSALTPSKLALRTSSIAGTSHCLRWRNLVSHSKQWVVRSMAHQSNDGHTTEAYNKNWEDKYWSKGVPQGQFWDIAQPTPRLLEAIDKQQVDVKGKRCLVPGCGRGYDVLALAAAGADKAMGLDLAPGALAAADDLYKQWTAEGKLTKQQADSVKFELADFFQWQPEGGPADVGYDYTFGCAMHPTMRAQWAHHWARLMKPGGTLVTMIYPINPEADPNTGPPFPVSIELYKELLCPAGFELQSIEMLAPEQSVPQRQGKEALGIWQRVATAEIS